MEGGEMKVYYSSSFKRTGTSLQALNDTKLRAPGSGPWEEVVREVVEELYQVTSDELDGSRRLGRIAWPRQVAMALTYQYGLLSAAAVGDLYGGRHYATVYWARGQVEKAMRKDGLRADEVRLVYVTAKKRMQA
jgi:chromosomal replication initiation ATPase DnaA